MGNLVSVNAIVRSLQFWLVAVLVRWRPTSYARKTEGTHISRTQRRGCQPGLRVQHGVPNLSGRKLGHPEKRKTVPGNEKRSQEAHAVSAGWFKPPHFEDYAAQPTNSTCKF